MRRTTSVHIVIIAAVLQWFGVASVYAASERPNIVILMADDLGFSDIGAYGSEIQTPNLDRLAAGGLRYTQFYNATVCCPSRASLMTGLYPHAAGMGAMNHRKDERPAYRGQLHDHVPTIAEALRPARYATWMVGKWHLTWADAVDDKPNGSWPLQRGFDRRYGTMEGAKDYFKPSRLFDGESEVQEFAKDYYYERAISSRAAEWIREQKTEQPFFLYVAFYAPHFPLQAPDETIAKYRGKYRVGWDKLRAERLQRQIASGLLPSGTQLSPRTPTIPAWDSLSEAQQDELDHRMAIYAAQVDELDQAVGRVLRALEETKRMEQTLIVFLSDNGGGSRGGAMGQGKASELNAPGVLSSTYGAGWANLSNTPYRHYKMETYAGGNAAPLIVHWPERIRKAGLRQQTAHIMDLMPTCLEVAGAKFPAQFNGKTTVPLSGRSLVSTFDANTSTDRDLFWEFNGSRAVRSGDWKLVALNKKSPWELYNLKEDPTELRDLASKRQKKATELESLWKTWARTNGVLPLR